MTELRMPRFTAETTLGISMQSNLPSMQISMQSILLPTSPISTQDSLLLTESKTREIVLVMPTKGCCHGWCDRPCAAGPCKDGPGCCCSGLWVPVSCWPLMPKFFLNTTSSLKVIMSQVSFPRFTAETTLGISMQTYNLSRTTHDVSSIIPVMRGGCCGGFCEPPCGAKPCPSNPGKCCCTSDA